MFKRVHDIVRIMKVKDILPQAAIGALVTIVLLVILESYAAMVLNASQLDSDPMMATIIGMAFLVFAVGGFVASFLSSKKTKDALDRAMATSVLTGMFTVLAIGALTLLSSMGSMTLITMTEVLTMLILLGMVGVFAAVLGGLVLSLMVGKGKSIISAAVKRMWKTYRTQPSAFIAPIVFTILLWALTLIGEEAIMGMGDFAMLAAIVFALITILLSAFAVTSVILAMEKKRKLKVLFRESIKRGKEVFVAMVIITVPVLLVGGLVLFGVLADPNLAELFTVFSPLLLLGMGLYMLAMLFVPQVVLLSKKGVRKSFMESYKFVKKRWMLIFGLMGVILVIMVAAELLFLAVDFIAFTNSADSSALTSFVSATINLLAVTGLTTGLYLEAKK